LLLLPYPGASAPRSQAAAASAASAALCVCCCCFQAMSEIHLEWYDGIDDQEEAWLQAEEALLDPTADSLTGSLSALQIAPADLLAYDRSFPFSWTLYCNDTVLPNGSVRLELSYNARLENEQDLCCPVCILVDRQGYISTAILLLDADCLFRIRDEECEAEQRWMEEAEHLPPDQYLPSLPDDELCCYLQPWYKKTEHYRLAKQILQQRQQQRKRNAQHKRQRQNRAAKNKRKAESQAVIPE
jgi:hypothetical protein